MDSASSKRNSELPRSFSHKNNNSSNTPTSSSSKSTGLRRSHSVKNPSLPSSSLGASSLPRSSSLRASPSDTALDKGSGNIARKYSSMAKEQKARFYIMRRCVAMLVCWHKHGD